MAKKLSIFISHPSEFLTDHQPHGDGLMVFEFILRLAQRGHTIHIPGPSARTISQIDIQQQLPENVHFYPAELWTSFETLNPIEYMIRVRQIFDHLCRSTNIDIVHQLNPVNPGLSWSVTNRKIPLVLGVFVPSWPAGSAPLQYKASMLGALSSSVVKPFVRWCDRQQQLKAEALLLSTPAARSRLYNPDNGRANIKILPYGIDPQKYCPADQNSSFSTNGELNILYLARLHQQKGIFTLLEAFDLVVKYVSSCRLTIAGTGPELPKIKAYIQTRPYQQQITLTGAVSREQVPQIMQQCTVYCLPSYGEPFGMSALEAMACGKPVVATNAGGLAHLVPDQGGRKVPPGDAIALAKALIEILASPELQHSMGQHNRALVESQYSWERIIDRLEEIYYRAIANHN